MKKLSRTMTLSVLVSGLSLLTACGGAEQEAPAGELGQSMAADTTACRTQTRQYASCVGDPNLIYPATCNPGETRTSYTLLDACGTNSSGTPNAHHAITWTCCPAQ